MLSPRSLLTALIVASLAAAAIAEDPEAVANERPLAVSVATHSLVNDATGLINKNAVMSGQNVAVMRSNVVAQQNDVLGAMDEAPQASGAPMGLKLMVEHEALLMPASDEEEGSEPTATLRGAHEDHRSNRRDDRRGDRDDRRDDRRRDRDDRRDDRRGDRDDRRDDRRGDRDDRRDDRRRDRDDRRGYEAGEIGRRGDRDDMDRRDDRDVHGFVGYRRRFFYPHFRGGYYGWRYPLRYWRRYGRRFYGDECPFSRIYGDYIYC